MMYAVSYDEEIRLWWDPRKEKGATHKYRIIMDGKSCVYTDKVYYNFKNLTAGKEYVFTLCLVDENKKEYGKEEIFRASTLPEREVVDITKAPYNAVGDGKRDNTAIIKKALQELKQGKRLYIPMGVYICEGVPFSGNMDIRLAAGAIVCSKERGARL